MALGGQPNNERLGKHHCDYCGKSLTQRCIDRGHMKLCPNHDENDKKPINRGFDLCVACTNKSEMDARKEMEETAEAREEMAAAAAAQEELYWGIKPKNKKKTSRS